MRVLEHVKSRRELEDERVQERMVVTLKLASHLHLYLSKVDASSHDDDPSRVIRQKRLSGGLTWVDLPSHALSRGVGEEVRLRFVGVDKPHASPYFLGHSAVPAKTPN